MYTFPYTSINDKQRKLFEVRATACACKMPSSVWQAIDLYSELLTNIEITIRFIGASNSGFV